jgi:hypothetical protein
MIIIMSCSSRMYHSFLYTFMRRSWKLDFWSYCFHLHAGTTVAGTVVGGTIPGTYYRPMEYRVVV